MVRVSGRSLVCVLFCFTPCLSFRSQVKKWLTINEPWSFVHHGYSTGMHAPGRCSDRQVFFQPKSGLLGVQHAVFVQLAVNLAACTTVIRHAGFSLIHAAMCVARAT